MRVTTLSLIALLLLDCKKKPEESQSEESTESPHDTRISDVSASSSLADSQNRYRPTALIDRNPTTSWVEGKKDDGLGESVTFSFTGRTDIATVQVTNGFHELGYYKINNRVREILFTTDEGGKFQATLEDTDDPQTIQFPTPLKGSKLQLTIVSIYKSDRDRDTALTEIRISSSNSFILTPTKSLVEAIYPKGLPESFEKESRISNAYYYQHLIFVSEVINDEVHFIFYTPEKSCSFFIFKNVPEYGISHREHRNSCTKAGDTLTIGDNVFRARDKKLTHDKEEGPHGKLHDGKYNDNKPVAAYSRATWKWHEFPTDTMKGIAVDLLRAAAGPEQH